MSWKTTGKKERDLAKFVKAGTTISINMAVAPKATTVKGKFGEQRMYVVETKEFGLVYMRPLKIAMVAELIGDLTTGYLVTEA